jgi:lipoate-protein ligase A
MRLPRHDTSLRLPAEPPAEAIAADEALLNAAPSTRLWVPAAPAVVVGVGLRHRLAGVVDLERCRAGGVQVLDRSAGGGALLLDEHVLCGAVSLPVSDVPADVTDSYRWLGDLLVSALAHAGVVSQRVEIGEARADVAALRGRTDPVAKFILHTCYGALSPHEVAVDRRKLVGIAQIRRKFAALFQFGVLLRDQAPLADYLLVPDAATREQLRAELRKRTIGLDSFGLSPRSASEVASAIADAMPSAP